MQKKELEEERQLKEKFIEETGEKYPSNENYKYTEWLTKLILSSVVISKTKEIMNRQEQAEFLKQELAKLLNDDKNNPVATCHVDKQLFIEMAFCFIGKHGK